jgi:hypothetical protein
MEEAPHHTTESLKATKIFHNNHLPTCQKFHLRVHRMAKSGLRKCKVKVTKFLA